MSGDHVLMPSPVMEVISVPNVATAATPHATVLETKSKYILYKIVTPYYVKAWHLALQHADLLHLFLNLVHDLTYGSPIGNPPPLSHTFISNNLGSADIDPAYMDSFLVEEVTSGRMDGPFTVNYAHQIFNGHFRMAPLSFVESQVQQHCASSVITQKRTTLACPPIHGSTCPLAQQNFTQWHMPLTL